MIESDTLHLGCGTNPKPHAHNVDKLDHECVDETVDLEDYPWPWVDESFTRIIAEHVLEHLSDTERTLRECERVLRPGGTLTVVMPVGQNSWVDPDHEHRWNWDTPEMYCGAQPWNPDVGLTVVEKDCCIHSHFTQKANWLHSGLIRILEHYYGAGRWMFDFPVTSGEFTVVFEK